MNTDILSQSSHPTWVISKCLHAFSKYLSRYAFTSFPLSPKWVWRTSWAAAYVLSLYMTYLSLIALPLLSRRGFEYVLYIDSMKMSRGISPLLNLSGTLSTVSSAYFSLFYIYRLDDFYIERLQRITRMLNIFILFYYFNDIFIK